MIIKHQPTYAHQTTAFFNHMDRISTVKLLAIVLFWCDEIKILFEMKRDSEQNSVAYYHAYRYSLHSASISRRELFYNENAR